MTTWGAIEPRRADVLRNCISSRVEQLQDLLRPAVIEALGPELGQAHRVAILDEMDELRRIWREIEGAEAFAIRHRARHATAIRQLLERAA